MGSRRRRGAAWAGVAALVAVLVAPSPPASAADDLEAAQRRANKAADELARATEEMARADDSVANLESRVARVDARVAAVRDQVRQLAVRQYVQGTAQITRLFRMVDANQVVRAQQFASVIAETSTEALEQFRADRQDLRLEVAELEREQKARAATVEDLRRRRADAVKELDRLTKEAAEARAAREEQERRAAANTVTTAGAAAGSPSQPAPAPGPTTRAPAPSVTAKGDWICPVQGPHAFSDDYGAPRGGGRSHQGNDILAARGTPVVANVGGVVTHRDGAISGLAYFLVGDDGNRYFGAHLDAFGASGRVAAGTVIGRVGNTGDAAGGPPHLHFEIHPGGSGYTNPYPTLRKYC